MATPAYKPQHPYVTHQKGTCDGKPIIKGTRIRVAQIAIEYERMRMSPDEIIEAHPHLTLAQVHDALSYYYENVEAVNADIRAGQQFIEEMKRSAVLEEERGDAENLHR